MLACAMVVMAAAVGQPGLRELDRFVLAPDHSWLGTQVGGISGIDYEPKWDMWALISDDKGDHGPVRGYLAEVDISGERLVGVEVNLLLSMCWGTGELMKGAQYDGEAIRILPHADYFGEATMVWATEGSAQRGEPARVYEVCTGATRMDSWTAPEWAKPVGRSSGARHNRAYESIAVVAERVGVVATEEPLWQDGQTYVRLTYLDLNTPESEPVRELAYPLDAPKKGVPGAENGLVDLYGLEGGRLLSMERSWSLTGDQSIRVFLVETEGATDVLGVASLNSGEFAGVRKTLIADLGGSLGNAEGLCIGPRLENGSLSLVLCTDNNFAPGMPTVFALYEIVDPDGVVVPADRLGARESFLGAR